MNIGAVSSGALTSSCVSQHIPDGLSKSMARGMRVVMSMFMLFLTRGHGLIVEGL